MTRTKLLTTLHWSSARLNLVVESLKEQGRVVVITGKVEGGQGTSVRAEIIRLNHQ